VSDLKLFVESERHRLDIFITWLCRAGVAVFFIYIGSTKFGPTSGWIPIFDRIGLGQWFRYLTGTMQIGGGILLLIPQTGLLGATILASTMLGAVVAQLFILHGGIVAIMPAALLAGVIAVGWQAYASRF
jgi:uncharacterized membrane protein YphA (DoxX/SURF4 family)